MRGEIPGYDGIQLALAAATAARAPCSTSGAAPASPPSGSWPSLVPGGRFVFCDVVVPDGSVPRPVPLDEDYDRPSSVSEQVAWLVDAGLRPPVVRTDGDVAILAAQAPVG